ncbi:MAG: flagellar hook-basal body complex protein FliE [Clostridia bacterium]|nr:flagellar hook-basal body complex protein FliE [Clostridia bacterium]
MPLSIPSVLLPQTLGVTPPPRPQGEIVSQGTVAALASFKEVLGKYLEEINFLQQRADSLSQHYLAGQVEDLHQVMLAAEQANLALQLAVQVRNKIIEAYQEIARMQI